MLNTGAKYLQIKRKSPTKHFPFITHVGRQQNALTTYMEYYDGEASSLYDCVVQTNA
jgi:hypothetical protein